MKKLTIFLLISFGFLNANDITIDYLICNEDKILSVNTTKLDIELKQNLKIEDSNFQTFQTKLKSNILEYNLKHNSTILLDQGFLAPKKEVYIFNKEIYIQSIKNQIDNLKNFENSQLNLIVLQYKNSFLSLFINRASQISKGDTKTFYFTQKDHINIFPKCISPLNKIKENIEINFKENFKNIYLENAIKIVNNQNINSNNAEQQIIDFFIQETTKNISNKELSKDEYIKEVNSRVGRFVSLYLDFLKSIFNQISKIDENFLTLIFEIQKD